MYRFEEIWQLKSADRCEVTHTSTPTSMQEGILAQGRSPPVKPLASDTRWRRVDANNVVIYWIKFYFFVWQDRMIACLEHCKSSGENCPNHFFIVSLPIGATLPLSSKMTLDKCNLYLMCVLYTLEQLNGAVKVARRWRITLFLFCFKYKHRYWVPTLETVSADE